MNESFEHNEFSSELSEETKRKLKNCKNEDEAMEILKSDKVSIPDEVLDAVSGGGDSRKDVTSGQMAKDFEEGRITGADFF